MHNLVALVSNSGCKLNICQFTWKSTGHSLPLSKQSWHVYALKENALRTGDWICFRCKKASLPYILICLSLCHTIINTLWKQGTLEGSRSNTACESWSVIFWIRQVFFSGAADDHCWRRELHMLSTDQAIGKAQFYYIVLVTLFLIFKWMSQSFWIDHSGFRCVQHVETVYWVMNEGSLSIRVWRHHFVKA